jgi:curved DNA-binding protein CbpA
MKIGPGQGANVNLPALHKFLEDLKTKDHYARLKLERVKGLPPMLKSNYFQLAKLYHPDTVPPDGPEEARKVKENILALLNEANAVLSDEAKRNDYFEELVAKEELGDVDVEAILAAEEDFQQAMALAKSRKFADALAIIERCIKVSPKEGEFYAWRGYCRFFGSQDKKTFRDMALEDQAKALSLNPKCVIAYVFTGQIFKLLEDIPRAKAAFTKTLEMDPNNIEAQRELRLFEQRKK